MSAIGRVLQEKLGTVYALGQKKPGRLGSCTGGWCGSGQRARVGGSRRGSSAFDEMWSYVWSRRKGNRREVWVWTAVVVEADGSRWVDFEVGDRSAETFLRLYARLPEAEKYRSDAYQVYDWLPANRHVVGKGGEVNWNEGLHSRWRDS